MRTNATIMMALCKGDDNQKHKPVILKLEPLEISRELPVNALACARVVGSMTVADLAEVCTMSNSSPPEQQMATIVPSFVQTLREKANLNLFAIHQSSGLPHQGAIPSKGVSLLISDPPLPNHQQMVLIPSHTLLFQLMRGCYCNLFRGRYPDNGNQPAALLLVASDLVSISRTQGLRHEDIKPSPQHQLHEGQNGKMEESVPVLAPSDAKSTATSSSSSDDGWGTDTEVVVVGGQQKDADVDTDKNKKEANREGVGDDMVNNNIHPPSAAFGNCKFGDHCFVSNCTDRHTGDDGFIPASVIMCRYHSACWYLKAQVKGTGQCFYYHPPEHIEALEQQQELSISPQHGPKHHDNLPDSDEKKGSARTKESGRNNHCSFFSHYGPSQDQSRTTASTSPSRRDQSRNFHRSRYSSSSSPVKRSNRKSPDNHYRPRPPPGPLEGEPLRAGRREPGSPPLVQRGVADHGGARRRREPSGGDSDNDGAWSDDDEEGDAVMHEGKKRKLTHCYGGVEDDSSRKSYGGSGDHQLKGERDEGANCPPRCRWGLRCEYRRIGRCWCRHG